ncbi:peptidase domain-containing ABC transporter [Dinghuibacter silviterrae]|uniref:ATP-binding cassette subfamily B protein n=1 Tax=Dinghuibacter silviterrae TaxID=1539049 RepID=A0A4V6Q9Y0_9BACT|nr:peptidase domain-containing ABC transporter [Dinghuibacter silviterrae]TDW99152.1 ATP-binding cassette subfamily B protein [Dinghuibacter silviterrae]
MFTVYRQLNQMDCGPTCLRMVAKFYGKHYGAEYIRELMGSNKEGTSLYAISETAEKLGFRTRGVRIGLESLADAATLPCILHWNQDHFVVLVRVKGSSIRVADPAAGLLQYTREQFLDRWATQDTQEEGPSGIALLLEPAPGFYSEEGQKENGLNWGLVLRYLHNTRGRIVQVLAALGVSSLLQLALPFLTQSIVDVGINTQNLQFVTIVLIAQLMLVFSRTVIDFIRSRLLLGISMIVNLSVLSDFWIKVTKLPMSYFDSRHSGDTLQRLGDSRQIQSFLTGNALNTLFSMLNLVVFSVVLIIYNVEIFFIFAAGSVLYFFWIKTFMGVRRRLNYKTFHLSAGENNATLQLIQGMPELKLHQAEQAKRWEWENIQVRIFRLTLKTLNYNQLQQAGAVLISQAKDVFIVFVVAGEVIHGKLTLGAMLAVQYIIGQLSSPVEQLAGFLQAAQDAKISMERLDEVHGLEEEEKQGVHYDRSLPRRKDIQIRGLSFAYPGAGNEPVLRDIDLDIPEGQVTAIVGMSGSGKTTLMKLLLKFYEGYTGDVQVGDVGFQRLAPSAWRRACGAVMQEGFIFSDTVARNIALGEESIDYERLDMCCRAANIQSFIESLPRGYYTMLGAAGVGVSTGQKQRILIARALYKDPSYLFFDEATNALDTANESTIVENLAVFFKGRTVVVIAHRLSTVRNADKIVVMDQGRIVEEGTHEALSRARGSYYRLVKNQIEQ